jgi:hypothetical protein
MAESTESFDVLVQADRFIIVHVEDAEDHIEAMVHGISDY